MLPSLLTIRCYAVRMRDIPTGYTAELFIVTTAFRLFIRMSQFKSNVEQMRKPFTIMLELKFE